MTGAEQLLHAMNALRRDVLSIPRTALERVETVHVSLLAEQLVPLNPDKVRVTVEDGKVIYRVGGEIRSNIFHMTGKVMPGDVVGSNLRAPWTVR